MIEAGFLHDIAGYVDGRIAKVVLNGNYEIETFTVKTVTANTLALQYVVPSAEVTLISLVELRDATGLVLTSQAVHIPIAADHMMIHTIHVKEAL